MKHKEYTKTWSVDFSITQNENNEMITIVGSIDNLRANDYIEAIEKAKPTIEKCGGNVVRISASAKTLGEHFNY